MALIFQLGPASATAVTLLPEWDFTAPKKQLKSETRTQTGRLFRHLWANYESYKVPLEYVPASVANVVNSWWATQTNLILFITSSTATEVHSVQIMNDNAPLAKFHEPYDDYYDGVIELESVGGV